jgi:hypothetical protein
MHTGFVGQLLLEGFCKLPVDGHMEIYHQAATTGTWRYTTGSEILIMLPISIDALLE